MSVSLMSVSDAWEDSTIIMNDNITCDALEIVIQVFNERGFSVFFGVTNFMKPKPVLYLEPLLMALFFQKC